MEFTHLNSDGAAYMVDVTEKQPTVRTATAEGEVACSPEVMTALLRWWCGWAEKGCALTWCWGWVVTPVCVTKEYALVHCWVSGAAQCCSCWALAWISHVVVVGCVWGLCCVRTV